MMHFGRRTDGPSGRRLINREEVVLAASAQSLSSSRPVLVSDVSPLGAKLRGRALQELDPNVLVSVGDVDLFATIAWLNRDECGVKWDERLTAELMTRIKCHGQWANVMGIAA
jgi:hypothetical protein